MDDLTRYGFEDDGVTWGPMEGGPYVGFSDFDRLRRELAEAQEDAATYRQERDDIIGNYTKLERELAEAQRDAARAEYCERNALALDFDYGEQHECVIVIRLDPSKRYPASFRAAIDAAMSASPPAPSAQDP